MTGKENRKKLYLLLNLTIPIATLVVALAVYAIVSKAVGIELLVPSIPNIIKKFFLLFAQSSFYKAVAGTVGRAALSYFLSFAFAIILAVATKMCPYLRRALSPIILLVRIMPTMSIILIALIWFNSFQSTILVAFCVIFPMLYTSFCDAIESVDKDLIEMSKTYKVDRKSMIFKMYLPQALPVAFTGIKSSIGLNLKLVIAAEVLAQTAGSIGVYMQLSKIILDTSTLLAWTAVAIILGGIFELIVIVIEKKAVKGR
ncbi:MAG: ABC transporter permease subunit [Clostridia bacterium]|nr:ABC transporter permease subunit [Clostridia bacterium]